MIRHPTLVSGSWALGALLLVLSPRPAGGQEAAMRPIQLPAARHQGGITLDSALSARRSTREFSARAIRLADAAQLLWAAQGVNRPEGRRTAPSAGATYPLVLYLLAARVDGIEPGLYRYRPETHDLVPTGAAVRLADLAGAAWRQDWMQQAAAVLVFAAAYQRTEARYGARAERYVPMEVGHAAQNVYLEAAALGLGTTFAGAFVDSAMARALTLPAAERPLGLMPVGYPR